MKHRFALRTFKNAFAAVVVTSLLSCGGGGGGGINAVSDTALAPLPPAITPAVALPAPVTTTATATAPASTKTQAELEKFWKVYGAKVSFTPMYVEVLTKLLEAEDKVFAKDYQAARIIIDTIIAKYPLMVDSQPNYNVWWENYNSVQAKSPRPHLGEPGAYAHLRMLDDITKVGVSKPLPGTTPIQMTIVMPACSDTVDKTGQTLTNQLLNPEIEANSYEVVRQSLRLFQSYMLAISGGELRLELKFYKINSCFQIKKETGFVGGNYNKPMLELPAGVIEKTDMFWLIYPSDFDAKLDVGGGSGMGGLSGKPVFISEDVWVIKKRVDQGGGARTEVERRMYLPEWVQHEIFHHFFQSWPEFGLEKTSHQWFDRTTWPSDFNGKVEEDYYSEALRKRLYNAKPSIAEKLKRADK